MLRASHFQEWRSSAVDPEIISLNVESLEGDDALERLTENAIEAIGKDQKTPHSYQYETSPVAKILNRYKDMSSEGWWCSGINILSGGDSTWGCYKPDKPRLSTEKLKPIKYEHPAKTPTEIFALRVPDHIWQKIGDRYGIAPYCPLPKRDTDTPPLISNLGNNPGVSFWQWVIDNPSIPLLITEGAKKSGSLLTAGYAAVALPGIYSGYRQEKDSFGNIIGLPRLIPQLEAFCQSGREIAFFFDQDTKPKTVKNVRRAIEKTGKLLGYKGCKVTVARWSPYWKGCDDFIASQGVEALDQVFSERISLDQYKIENFSAITPDLTINERYIPKSLEIPENAKIIGIKAPKGRGKTEFIAAKIAPILAKGDRVLVLTHRVPLGLELSRRFGVNYRSELVKNEDGSLLGYVLCIDSLHGNANPRFNPNDWENTTIIIDECEQVFWHLLNSPTCEQYRVKIIDCLRELFRIVVSTGGKIYLADADLSMNAISYVQSLIGYSVPTYILENTYKSPLKRNLYLFGGNNPSSLIQELEIAVNSGQKVICHTDGQKHKSSYGTRNLEYLFKKKYPNLKILRIDSESVSDRSHPAYGCMGNLDQILCQYDLVICSPVIETGVSIDVNHFDAVFAISHGVQSVNAFCQTLARVRADIPRYIWVS
ncbi:plasmid replication protein, CyRepA1 family, partial [Microcystis aeruginosa]|uniref:plasmid replication protein, CyRepA1 family n=1 Tax=Microcystis aeruginosa TaxID=1126 RepID=UPI0020B108E7